MKKQLLIFAFFVFQLSFGQQKATTYYFIRHAEKVDNSQNPDLSEKGLERAKLWNEIFAEINFDQIYSTDYKRTVQTARFTAAEKKVEIKLYNPKNIIRNDFLKETVGKTILIVGHSNTTPNFVNQIINQNIYADITDSTFGNLYIVTIVGDVITHHLLKLP